MEREEEARLGVLRLGVDRWALEEEELLDRPAEELDRLGAELRDRCAEELERLGAELRERWAEELERLGAEAREREDWALERLPELRAPRWAKVSVSSTSRRASRVRIPNSVVERFIRSFLVVGESPTAWTHARSVPTVNLAR